MIRQLKQYRKTAQCSLNVHKVTYKIILAVVFFFVTASFWAEQIESLIRQAYQILALENMSYQMPQRRALMRLEEIFLNIWFYFKS